MRSWPNASTILLSVTALAVLDVGIPTRSFADPPAPDVRTFVLLGVDTAEGGSSAKRGGQISLGVNNFIDNDAAQGSSGTPGIVGSGVLTSTPVGGNAGVNCLTSATLSSDPNCPKLLNNKGVPLAGGKVQFAGQQLSIASRGTAPAPSASARENGAGGAGTGSGAARWSAGFTSVF
jgi:hypothetical protein